MEQERDSTIVQVIDSTGNVFADLGLPHSEEDMLKLSIARAITGVVRKRRLTQVEAAKLVGADQAKVSAVLRGRVDGFSVERLLFFLCRLGRDVNIHISPKSKAATGTIKVVAA